MGTEINTKALASAVKRKGVAAFIGYSKGTGALSAGPLSRVELLIILLSPLANMTYRWCRYLRQARAETLRKYQALHEHFEERWEKSIFDNILGQDKKEYILLGDPEQECRPALEAPYEPVAIHGWARLPGHSVTVPYLGRQASARDRVHWARM